MVKEHKGLAVHPFSTRAKFRTWLRTNHAKSPGIWLKFAKKASGVPTVTYEDAREEAIVHGWIDGLINGLDERFYLLRFTPRRPRSKWSKINREIAERLLAEEAMHPAGLAQVEAAKADGRWDRAYPSASTIGVHPMLAAALGRCPRAKAAFDELDGATRYSVLYSAYDTSNDTTRARRIAKAIAQLEARDVKPTPRQRKKTASKKRRRPPGNGNGRYAEFYAPSQRNRRRSRPYVLHGARWLA